MSTVDVVVGVVVVVGLVGIVVPVLPGLLLVWAGIAVWSTERQDATGWAVLAIVTLLAAAGTALKYLLPGRRMRAEGVPTGTMLAGGALGLVGFFVVPVVGLFLGFILGVYLAERGRLGQHRAAWSSTVIASGPVKVYVRPVWPGSISAAAAISATSRGSTTPCRPEPSMFGTGSPERSGPAQLSVLDANTDGRRITHSRPLARTASSPRPCATPPRPVRVSPAMIAESFTIRRTPAARAASAIPRSLSASSGPKTPTRNAESTPVMAAARAPASRWWPRAASTPGGNWAAAGSRVSARTFSPRARSCRRTSPPMVPVAPVTRIMATTVGAGPSRPIGNSGTFRGPGHRGRPLTVDG